MEKRDLHHIRPDDYNKGRRAGRGDRLGWPRQADSGNSVVRIMSEYTWKKSEYAQEHCHQPEVIRRVMIIYSGGTLGMKWNGQNAGYEPVAHYMEDKMMTYPMFNDRSYAIPEEETTAFEPFNPLTLPVTFHMYRILYCINEYSPLMDSCDMNMSDWAKLAKDVERYYHQFDAFVIVHGTDTMCYTASALSFMLENLNKPVILTGAQVPLSELRNDARDNLLEALIMAGSGKYSIPEVTIYCNNKLFRGNRSTKAHCASFDPFDSPNLAPLATVGVEVTVNAHLTACDASHNQLKIRTAMCRDVGILRIFPGITETTLGAFLQPPMKGVVLQTFGAGNMPARRFLLDKLKEACARGVIIVNTTQCMSGNVTTKYPAAKALCELGVVSGGDMTMEAALTKLSYLLARDDLDTATAREYMGKNLCGELTVEDSSSSLGFCVPKEVFPCLMCAAAAKGDCGRLLSLMKKGGSVAQCDYDGRSPLHLAASEGHSEAVKFLIQHGAPVNQQDRFNHTPLHDAVHFKRYHVINILVEKGATISSSEFTVENKYRIMQAVAGNDIEVLQAWHLAGAHIPEQSLMEPTTSNLVRSHSFA